MMKTNKINLYHAFTWFLLLSIALSACKTRQTVIDKTNTKTEVKKEEEKMSVKDSSSVKKEKETIKSEQQNDISKENKTVEEIINYLPQKDSAGKQLIASVIKREVNYKERDQSKINKEQVKEFLDSLKSFYKDAYNLKFDSIGESQTKNKDTKADSTVTANIPWWVWIMGLIALIFFLAFKFK